MIRFISMLFILLALMACSSNKTDYQNSDVNSIVSESRQMNEQEMKQFKKDYPVYKESIDQAIKDFNAIRDKLDLLMKDFEASSSDIDDLDKNVSDTHYSDSKKLNNIDYKNRINEIKDQIIEIEKYLQKSCCP